MMDDELALFEAWVRQWPNYSERTLARDDYCPEYYATHSVQGVWEGWQARAHLTQPAQAVDGWRPIETAPRDGTKILATGHDYGHASRARHYVVAKWLDGLFVEVTEDGDCELAFLTHWMPFSEIPTAALHKDSNGAEGV